MLQAKSLESIKVLVTRSRHQAHELTAKLVTLGAYVVEIPVISITCPDSWEPLDNALENLSHYSWCLFASVNAVESCIARLEAAGKGASELRIVRLAAIGPSTAQALSSRGLTPEFCPSRFIGEGLVAEFPGYPSLSGIHILWPRTNVGRNFVADKLQQAGAQVDIVQSYKTGMPANLDELADKLLSTFADGHIDITTLASAQSARNFAKLLSSGLIRANIPEDLVQTKIAELLNSVIIASIGPETSHAASQYLGKVDIEAKTYTIDGLIEAIVSRMSTTARSISAGSTISEA